MRSKQSWKEKVLFRFHRVYSSAQRGVAGVSIWAVVEAKLIIVDIKWDSEEGAEEKHAADLKMIDTFTVHTYNPVNVARRISLQFRL